MMSSSPLAPFDGMEVEISTSTDQVEQPPGAAVEQLEFTEEMRVVIDQILLGYTNEGPGVIVKGHSAENKAGTESYLRKNSLLSQYFPSSPPEDPLLPVAFSPPKDSYCDLGSSSLELTSQPPTEIMQEFLCESFNAIWNSQSAVSTGQRFSEYRPLGGRDLFAAILQPGQNLLPQPGAAKPVAEDQDDSGHGEEFEREEKESGPSSSLNDLDDPGIYGFDIRFPKSSDKKFIYNDDLKKAFVKRGEMWDVQFVFRTKPPDGSVVEVTAVRDDIGHMDHNVGVCGKDHKNGVPSAGQFLWSKGEGAAVEPNKLKLKVRPKGIKGVIDVQSLPSWTSTSQLACCCANSCIETKSRIVLVFKLTTCVSGTVKTAGVKRMEIRSCMCPSRDHAQSVKTAANPNKGRKRGVDDMLNSDGDVKASRGSSPLSSAQLSPGDLTLVEGGCSAWKKFKGSTSNVTGGLSQQYYREDSFICLDVHLRVDESKMVFIKSIQASLDVLQLVHAIPGLGSIVPVSQLMRTKHAHGPSSTVNVRPAPVTNSQQQRMNADEIRSWLQEIVQVTDGITETLFTCNGVMSLDEIFQLDREGLQKVLVSLKDEVIDKFWFAVQEKKRPTKVVSSSQLSMASQGK